MENEKFKKCVGFWSRLNKHIKSTACTIGVVAMASVTLTGCHGEKTGSSKGVNSQTAENALEIFLEHDGKDFLNNVPEACKDAVVNNYNITESELEETISTFANALYGKAYSWDFSIEDKQYDVTAKEISSESAGEVTLKELQN